MDDPGTLNIFCSVGPALVTLSSQMGSVSALILTLLSVSGAGNDVTASHSIKFLCQCHRKILGFQYKVHSLSHDDRLTTQFLVSQQSLASCLITVKSTEFELDLSPILICLHSFILCYFL